MLHYNTIITSDTKGYGIDLLTGESVPWTFTRNKGCGTVLASEHLLTFRSAGAAFFNLAATSGTGHIGQIPFWLYLKPCGGKRCFLCTRLYTRMRLQLSEPNLPRNDPHAASREVDILCVRSEQRTRATSGDQLWRARRSTWKKRYSVARISQCEWTFSPTECVAQRWCRKTVVVPCLSHSTRKPEVGGGLRPVRPDGRHGRPGCDCGN